MAQTELVSYGVDYLTLTSKTLLGWNSEEGRNLRYKMLDEYYDGRGGMITQPWCWNGYAGVRVGAMNMGTRPDGSIIRISGGAARVMVEAEGLDEFRGTRVDLQATVRLTGTTASECIQHQAELVDEALAGRNGRPSKMALTKGFGDGDTLTVGSRSSQMYWRIYDKGLESRNDPAYEGCVRIELECKGEVAKRVWTALRNARVPNETAFGLLVSTSVERGFSLIAGRLDTQVPPLKTQAQTTDIDRQLMWLETSVKGVIKRLLYEGREEDVIHALGLKRYLSAHAPSAD